jgi:integrase
MKSERIAEGVFKDKHGLRAFVRLGPDNLPSKRFKPDGLQTAKRWREEVKAKHVLKLTDAPTAEGGTLSADAERYLQSVQGMPSYADRKRDMDAWCRELGTRVRASITAVDVRTALEKWRKQYAASTLNHRRTALMHLFRVLDGKSAPNPVADVPKYAEQQHAALIHTPAQIALALSTMKDGKYKRVLSVLAWTGWPYKQIAQLTKADLSKLEEGVARVTPRRKGAGSAGRWVPLLPPAIDALKALKLPTRNPETNQIEGDTVAFHRRVAWQAWRDACTAAGIEPCRPYDLRHAFGTLIAKETADARAVYELMLHADPKQALRYTQAAGVTRAQAAITLVTTSNWKGAKGRHKAPQDSSAKKAHPRGKTRK